MSINLNSVAKATVMTLFDSRLDWAWTWSCAFCHVCDCELCVLSLHKFLSLSLSLLTTYLHEYMTIDIHIYMNMWVNNMNYMNTMT